MAHAAALFGVGVWPGTGASFFWSCTSCCRFAWSGSADRLLKLVAAFALQHSPVAVVIHTFAVARKGERPRVEASHVEVVHAQQIKVVDKEQVLGVGGMQGAAQAVLCVGAETAAVGSTPQVSLGGSPCLLYTSPSPRDKPRSRMPSSA